MVGLRDWLIQRFTAVILGVYIVSVAFYFLMHQTVSYTEWRSLFQASAVVKYGTLLALLSLVSHAWIGVWTIITDYIKPVAVRLCAQILTILLLGFYTAWGIDIIWI